MGVPGDELDYCTVNMPSRKDVVHWPNFVTRRRRKRREEKEKIFKCNAFFFCSRLDSFNEAFSAQRDVSR
jgi:hypothetical protein